MELFLAFESRKRSGPLVRIFASYEKRDKHKRLRTQIRGRRQKKLRENSRERTVQEFKDFKIGCSLFLVKVLAKSGPLPQRLSFRETSAASFRKD